MDETQDLVPDPLERTRARAPSGPEEETVSLDADRSETAGGPARSPTDRPPGKLEGGSFGVSLPAAMSRR